MCQNWASSGPMLLASCQNWASSGTMLPASCQNWAGSRPMLGRCWADAGPMLGRCCLIRIYASMITWDLCTLFAIGSSVTKLNSICRFQILNSLLFSRIWYLLRGRKLDFVSKSKRLVTVWWKSTCLVDIYAFRLQFGVKHKIRILVCGSRSLRNMWSNFLVW